MAALDESQWDLLARQASAAGLMARLAVYADDLGITSALPQGVQRRMDAMRTIARQQQRAVHWELTLLQDALAGIEGPIVLLKGAAYAAAGLPPAAGRLFGDIDLMVPREQLDATEAALMLDGWAHGSSDAYDERYYREWMHEIPPMVQVHRQTVLDLHHSILPPTARIRTRPGPIFEAARPLERFPRLRVPCATDLVLHSATHLFHEGEWHHGLRDLVDLDAMLQRFSRDDPGFWDALLARAELLGLGRPLFYALRCCEHVLGTAMPTGLQSRCPSRPGALTTQVMDALLLRGLGAAHHSLRGHGSGPAEFALYVRSHWLRMPVHLLVPHLVRKAWMRRVEARFAPAAAATAAADAHTP